MKKLAILAFGLFCAVSLAPLPSALNFTATAQAQTANDIVRAALTKATSQEMEDALFAALQSNPMVARSMANLQRSAGSSAAAQNAIGRALARAKIFYGNNPGALAEINAAAGALQPAALSAYNAYTPPAQQTAGSGGGGGAPFVPGGSSSGGGISGGTASPVR